MIGAARAPNTADARWAGERKSLGPSTASDAPRNAASDATISGEYPVVPVEGGRQELPSEGHFRAQQSSHRRPRGRYGRRDDSAGALERIHKR